MFRRVVQYRWTSAGLRSAKIGTDGEHGKVELVQIRATSPLCDALIVHYLDAEAKVWALRRTARRIFPVHAAVVSDKAASFARQ